MGDLLFSHKLLLSHAWRLILCGLFLVVLFVEWLRRSPWDLGNYETVNAPVGSDALVARGGLFAAGAVLLANPQASSTMIAELLYTGPRLVLGTWPLIRRAQRLRTLDAHACAPLLAILLERGGAVGYEELRGAGWEPWFDQLRCVSGVVFLEKGLSLSAEGRAELNSGLEKEAYATI